MFNVEVKIFSEQFTVLKVFDEDCHPATLELLLVIRGKTLVHGSEAAKSNSSRVECGDGLVLCFVLYIS